MKVTLSPDAEETLDRVAEFIDSENTEGAGRFWVTNFILNLYSYAKPNVKYALCQHRPFFEAGLSCIAYNGWVIVFELDDNELYVYYVVRGNLLT